MKTSTTTTDLAHKHRAARGSSLILVMMLCVATLILVGSFLRYATTQSRIAARATLAGEARSAAEGVAEYALGEMTRRAAANPTFGVSVNPLSGYTLPSSDLTYLAPGTGNNHVVSAEVEFKAGAFIAAGAMTELKAMDPVFATDPLNGQILNVRLVKIYGKAAVRDPQTQGLITSYISETLQIREQAWFNYAVFFNMDMEFHAGSNVDIYGPVFTNANAYVNAGNGYDLNFYSNLTAVKKILREIKYDGSSTSFTGDVSIANTAGTMITMSTSQDSDTTASGGFRTLSNSRWNDRVQDKTYTVLKFDPPGLPAYVPDDFTTSAIELRNNAYSMIEPQLSLLTTDGDYGRKSLDRENLKFSALSGFVIEVLPPGAIGAQPQWMLHVYRATDTAHLISADNPPARDATTGKPLEVAGFPLNPFTASDETTTTVALAQMKKALKKALMDAIISIPYGDAGTLPALNPTVWGNGFSALKAFNQAAPATTTGAAYTYYPVYDRREGYIYNNSATSNTNGLKGAMNVLRIDLGRLNTLLNDTTGLWLKPDSTVLYNVAGSYTGVVYVQFPLATIDLSRFPTPVGTGPAPVVTDPTYPDQIRRAQGATTTTPGYAVVLANAGTLPQRAGGTPDGFTFATNGPLYIHGNYNADGNPTTGSSTAPDSGSEVPAMIAADAVTILSPEFTFTAMATTESAVTTPNTAITEISAAIVTGLIPTRPNDHNIWQGGVHNFARFHENWSGKTYRYRGSLAALFECEVVRAPFRQNYYTYWYDPPDREVGYHAYLAAGRFPPGTPVKRTVRRMNLEDISAATYATGP